VSLDGPFIPGQVSRGQITYPGYEHLKWEVVLNSRHSSRRNCAIAFALCAEKL